jgi:endonuclease YncB( thermonuclease family)
MALSLISGLLLTFAFTFTVNSAELAGWVVGVHDGDTITLLDAEKGRHKVRLAGIDAPELGQPFGRRSKENLSQWAFNRSVIVDWSKKDRYGRIVGKLLVDGNDVNLEQVKAGLAWWYRAYAKEQSPEDRGDYEKAEKSAQDSRKGLWGDTSPVPPWEWRRR